MARVCATETCQDEYKEWTDVSERTSTRMICHFFVFTGPNFQFLARMLRPVTAINRFPPSWHMLVVRHL
jgi:hypothetical protein